MHETVYRVMRLLCAVVARVPIGTNLGLVCLLWLLVSGRLLTTRGAVIPGLSALGLSAPAVRRAWAALGQGGWTSATLLECWASVVEQEHRWRAHEHEGYRPVAVDLTGFWRPRLRACPTTHYDGRAGKALPAIPLGLVARVGSVDGQRLGLPLAFVRADPADPSEAVQARALVQAAVAGLTERDALIVDAGFGVRRLQEGGATRYVVREAKNVTARRARPPAYAGRGRPPTRGEVVRPLARTYRGRRIPATAPDRVTTWQEDEAVIRAEEWQALVRPDAVPGSPTFRLVAIHDPRWTEPLLLASPLAVSARALRDLYLDRWPVEQVPLAAKQMLGAGRQFVSAPETCQRLPELALLAGAILSYAAATQPAVPTGFWDRRPQPTPGRLRRVLAQARLPMDFPFPARIREKAAVTAHLPKGFWGQRRPRSAEPTLAQEPGSAQADSQAA
ncbi:MAG TPA: hypothetical protein VHN78_13320 [Chloroflexota bacterium]|nr:hypothetical protein [Chloroflexota bacterium]